MWASMNSSSSLQGGRKQQFARHVSQQHSSSYSQPVRQPTRHQRKPGRLLATTSDDAANSSSDLLFPIQDYFHLGSGDTIPMPRKRPDVGPLAEYDREEAINVQMKVNCGYCTAVPAADVVVQLEQEQQELAAAGSSVWLSSSHGLLPAYLLLSPACRRCRPTTSRAMIMG
jgi:hypothetical protein